MDLIYRGVRTRFFEEPQFRIGLSHLPDDPRPVAQVVYITGWRAKTEILTRQWKHVDLKGRFLRLQPGDTKNGEGECSVHAWIAGRR